MIKKSNSIPLVLLLILWCLCHAGQAQTVVPFESTNTVSGQSTQNWAYFQIVVPSDVLGWDIRIQNVTTGDPRLSVRRDVVPDSLRTHDSGGRAWSPYLTNAWPTGYQIAPSLDWTGYRVDSSFSNRVGHILQCGIGNPLQPGTYIVGVTNGTGPGSTNAMSYTLVSRGIGTNYSIPVTSLSWSNGSATMTSLAPADPAWFSIQVPTDAPSWKLKLSETAGESLVVLQRAALPSIGASLYNTAPLLDGGKLLQKLGDEFYLLLPDFGQTNVPGGTYYVGVVGEGNNPSTAAGGRLGTGTSTCTLLSVGSITPTNLGTVDKTGKTDLIIEDSSEGGDALPYQFQVPPGTASVELFLENRVGNPVMTLRPDDQFPYPPQSYGRDGGQPAYWASFNFIYLPNVAPVTYTLMVTASTLNNLYPNASYQLRIHALTNSPSYFITPPPFTYASGTFAANLEVSTNVAYRIQASTDLINWVTITNITSPTPVTTVTDPLAGGYGARFYRAVTP